MTEYSHATTLIDEAHPLRFTYVCYKDMFDNNIIFSYRGLVTSDLVTNVLEIMEERMEEHGQSKKITKKVSNVMVECLTNVYVDEEKDPNQDKDYDPTALLLVKKVNSIYHVVTGAYIPNKRVTEIKRMIDRINQMTPDELKAYYQENLAVEDPTMQGLTNLAIIDLARKSKNRLVYNFKYETLKYTFFVLESQISKNSI